MIRQLKQNGLVLKIKDELHDLLSCEIKYSKDRKRAWLGQPYLISNLEKKFGDQVKGLQTYKTPGTPGLNMVHNTDPKHALSQEKHKLFCSGVGMLIWLDKHLQPDIANCVRKLSKVLDGTTEASYKEMLCAIKYVMDSCNLGLKI